jgi:uracil-DNA glycosylase
VDERRLHAWHALGIGPVWVRRDVGDGSSLSESGLSGSALSGWAPSADWPSLEAEVAACTRCGLCEGRTNTVFGSGPRDARWMLVGEAPGAEEDASGEPFAGEAGRLLDRMLAAIGLDRARDAFVTNLVKCRPPREREPLAQEVAQCAPYLARQVELLQPALIVALGGAAAQALLRSDAEIANLRGQVHRYRAAGVDVPLVVTHHPADLLRNPSDKARAWADLCLARATAASAADLRVPL